MNSINKQMENPLVSVAVITYNSSKYVLETLESAKSQTYQNIELIISDDCSTDNTVQICKDWVEQNKNRFVRTQIVETPQNTGVSANCNRAEDACQGEWVKLIAGDDILLSNCIEDYVGYVLNHLDSYYVFGKVKVIGATKIEFNDYTFFDLSLEEQLEKIIFGAFIPASSCFYNRKKTIELGIRYDERIPLFEDTPRWINVMKHGVHLDFLDRFVVKYRVGHMESLSSGLNYLPNFMESKRLVHFYYIYPELLKINKEKAIREAVDFEMKWYKNYMSLSNSVTYKLSNILLFPIRFICKFVHHE